MKFVLITSIVLARDLWDARNRCSCEWIQVGASPARDVVGGPASSPPQTKNKPGDRGGFA